MQIWQGEKKQGKGSSKAWKMDSAANQRFHGNKELGKMTSSRQEIIKNGSRTPKRRKWRKLYQSERLEDRDRWKKKIPQYNLGTETLVKIFKIHKGNQKFPMKHGHALPCPKAQKSIKQRLLEGLQISTRKYLSNDVLKTKIQSTDQKSCTIEVFAEIQKGRHPWF